jgi:hypothetical protein
MMFCVWLFFLVEFLESYVYRDFAEALSAQVQSVFVYVRPVSSASYAFLASDSAASFLWSVVLDELFVFGGFWSQLC